MDDAKKFVRPSEACRLFKISRPTLLLWEASGRIKSYRVGSPTRGHRRFDISSCLDEDPRRDEEDKKPTAHRLLSKSDEDPVPPPRSASTSEGRVGISYCRVSSLKQRDDLTRQVEYLESLYPTYEIIKDCGSGLNYKRKGLQRLIQRIIDNKVSEVVIAHRDRLCRFGFELLQWLFSRFNTKITVLDNTLHSPETEFTNDLLDIIHVFSCRRNGRRRYKKKQSTGEAEEEDEDGGEEGGSCEDDVPIPRTNPQEVERTENL